MSTTPWEKQNLIVRLSAENMGVGFITLERGCSSQAHTHLLFLCLVRPNASAQHLFLGREGSHPKTTDFNAEDYLSTFDGELEHSIQGFGLHFRRLDPKTWRVTCVGEEICPYTFNVSSRTDINHVTQSWSEKEDDAVADRLWVIGEGTFLDGSDKAGLYEPSVRCGGPISITTWI